MSQSSWSKTKLFFWKICVEKHVEWILEFLFSYQQQALKLLLFRYCLNYEFFFPPHLFKVSKLERCKEKLRHYCGCIYHDRAEDKTKKLWGLLSVRARKCADAWWERAWLAWSLLGRGRSIAFAVDQNRLSQRCSFFLMLWKRALFRFYRCMKKTLHALKLHFFLFLSTEFKV